MAQLGSRDAETEASRTSELAAPSDVAEVAIFMMVNYGAARPAEPAPAFTGWPRLDGGGIHPLAPFRSHWTARVGRRCDCCPKQKSRRRQSRISTVHGCQRWATRGQQWTCAVGMFECLVFVCVNTSVI